MKAVVIEKPKVMDIKDVEIPIPPEGFARIKVKAAAICATDLEIIDGNIAANYPITPGHEWSGIVDCVGSKEDEQWVGKSVVGSSDVVCLKCEACRSGNWRYCESFEEIGFKRNGAYAEYMIVPVYGLCEKTENVPFDVACLCEPVGVALGTLKKARAKAGQNLVVFGAGSIGLCVLAVAKAMGLRKIIVCSRNDNGLKLAKKMGATETVITKETDVCEKIKELHPEGTDLVVDATGAEECIQNSLKILKRGGTVALAGYGKGKMMNIRIDDIHIKNLKMIGAGNNWNMHKKAMQMMADGSIDVSDFITERLSLSDFEKGLEDARKRPEGFVKAVFINE